MCVCLCIVFVCLFMFVHINRSGMSSQRGAKVNGSYHHYDNL